MNLNKINEIFDRQINASKKYNTSKEYQINKISKEIFNLTVDFDIRDWKTIRSGEYWNVLDSIKDELEKKQYTLSKIKEKLTNDFLIINNLK